MTSFLVSPDVENLEDMGLQVAGTSGSKWGSGSSCPVSRVYAVTELLLASFQHCLYGKTLTYSLLLLRDCVFVTWFQLCQVLPSRAK